MRIEGIAKYVAFEQVFNKYSLPSIVRYSDNTIKKMEEWMDEINLDHIDSKYKRDNFNIVKDNSFTEVLVYFKDPLINCYFEKLRFYKETEEKKEKEKEKEE